MIKVNVITNNSRWNNFIKDPNKYINTKIKKFNSREKKFFKKKLFFTLLLSGNYEIKKLNKKFRNKDKTTDVLSFPFQTRSKFLKNLKKENEIYLGDIIINLNKIKNRNNQFQIEFDRLWIHGLVHLLGYDHVSDKDFLLMKKIEEKYLNFIND